MATYNGLNFTLTSPQPSPTGDGRSLKVLDSGLVSVTTALANGDTGTLFTAPKGFTVLTTIVESTDMDTNGAPTAVLNIGDAGSASRLVASSTVMQAGTAAQSVVNTAIGYQYTADTNVTWIVPTGPATGATGSFRVWVLGYFQATVFS